MAQPRCRGRSRGAGAHAGHGASGAMGATRSRSGPAEGRARSTAHSTTAHRHTETGRGPDERGHDDLGAGTTWSARPCWGPSGAGQPRWRCSDAAAAADRTAPGGAACRARRGPRPEPAPRDPRPTARRGRPGSGSRTAGWPDRRGQRPAGRRGAAPDLTELLPQWLAAANAHGYARPGRAAARAAGRGPGAYRPAAGRRWPSPGRAGCGWPGSTPTGSSPCAAASGGAGDCPRPRRTAGGANGCGRRACSPSGSRCSPGYGPTTRGGRAGPADDHLADRAGRGPADVPRLAARGASARRRAVPGAGAGRPQPQCAGDGGRVAVRAARLGAGRTDGGSAPWPAWPWPHRHGTVHRRRGAARMRRGDAARRGGRRSRPPGGANGPGGWASWWRRPRWHAGRRGSAAASPAEIVALPVADGWRTELHAAWCRAAVRQRDPAWARALLGAALRPAGGRPRRRRRSRSGRSCWRPSAAAERADVGGRSSSRRTACRRRSSCSGCARCRGRSRWGGRWWTRSTSRGTRAATRGASAG